jgi:hypothetical protein
MSSKHAVDDQGIPIPSRRTFLMTGSLVVASLHSGQAPSRDRDSMQVNEKKIREIMERYGSELGRARLV